MSEWITDRLPTEDDADDNGDVLVHTVLCPVFRDYGSVEAGDPWSPVPKAYVPPKPKRRERTESNGNFKSPTLFREVLATDPTPEAIEEVAAELEVIAETIRIASDLQILADRGMYAEGIKRQAAKLREETDE